MISIAILHSPNQDIILAKIAKLSQLAQSILTPHGIGRANQISNPIKRYRYLSSRLLLQYLATHTQGDDHSDHQYLSLLDRSYRPLTSSTNEVLSHKTSRRFSISHTNSAEVVALLPPQYDISYPAIQLGVDIEDKQRQIPFEKLSRRYFSQESHQWICEHREPRYAFWQIWTQTEAIVKALGVGLANHLADICFDYQDEIALLSHEQKIQGISSGWNASLVPYHNSLIALASTYQVNQGSNTAIPYEMINVSLDQLLAYFSDS